MESVDEAFGFLDHELFRETVRGFVDREVKPNDAAWEEAGIVDRALFSLAGSQGLLGMAIPETQGGGAVDDFRFNAMIGEEIASASFLGSRSGMLGSKRFMVARPRS